MTRRAITKIATAATEYAVGAGLAAFAMFELAIWRI